MPNTSPLLRQQSDRPNLILMNCDDLGYGDLGCYGSAYNATPHLDRMAAEGVRFTDFYAASPVCSPSRGALMTGCYPDRISFSSFDGRGVLFPGQAVGLHPAEITIASLLRQQGYATACIGKWHCGDQPEFLPTRHGFDRYFGIPFSNDMGIQPTPPDCPPLPLLLDEEVIQEQPDQAGLTERYVEHSIRFIRKNRDRPFFLYLAHMHVHLPLYVAWRFLKNARNGPYGAAVEAIDWSMGMLRHELRRLGLERNTLIIFTSDNGSRGDRGGSNRPLSGAKNTTWEGGQRVPLIALWPGRVEGGRTCGELATAMDIMPTMAQLAGTQAPTDRVIDGRDIGPLLTTPGAASPHDAFFYYHGNRLEAVRDSRFKLRFRRDHAPCRVLHDLQNDTGESKDVSSDYPEAIESLEAKAQAMRLELGDALMNMPPVNFRPIGRVNNPKTLTSLDPEHPYMAAMYDLGDRG